MRKKPSGKKLRVPIKRPTPKKILERVVFSSGERNTLSKEEGGAPFCGFWGGEKS